MKELQTAKRPIDSSSCDQNSKIASVKVLKSGETAMVSDAAMERVPAEIVKTQSLRVDNVAGATLTSMAIQAAATKRS